VKRLAIVAVAAALPVVAGAQERSDLMPPPPPAPGGAQLYLPGMPLPAPPSPPPAPPPGKGSAPSGIILPEDGASFEAEGEVPGEVPPDTHVVQRGDTLWDLSQRYYKNAYAWPKLWSFNPQITNPHWIYPGDLIRLGLGGGGGGPAPTPAPTPEGPPRIVGRPRVPSGVFLRQNGFVEEQELAQAGQIVGSKEEKTMLGTLDEAYVEFPRERPLRVGERYTVYKVKQKVKHPLTGKVLGDMVEIFGEGEIRAVTDGGIARLAIVDSINPIERGYLVGPLRRQFKLVQPRAGAPGLSGVVVATLRPQKLIATDELIFVDRGKQDGVAVGTVFSVVRRGDGYQPVLQYGPVDNPRFPRERINDIVIVDVREHVSTGIVIAGVKEAQIGDLVETR
jgi:hypothetical protein